MDVLEVFLPVLDEGHLSDGRGRKVDFSQTVIIMTSNLGASELQQARTEKLVGFSRASEVSGDRQAKVMLDAAKSRLPPELYNRIDDVLVYRSLSHANMLEIAAIQLATLRAKLERRGIQLQVEDAVLPALLKHGGYDPTMGARPLRRAVGRWIEDPLSELVLSGEASEGAVILVGVDDDERIVVDAVCS
jgi:ATP-dependent Clp protease ATP-binding subunit ClpC